MAHDNPDFVFPEMVDGASVFEAKGLGHPLIPARVRVGNDVILGGPGTALLVTGSNMSGKSTLLRAMGLAAVLGLAGGPVCARHVRLSPMQVYTSMRISDSLLRRRQPLLRGAEEAAAPRSWRPEGSSPFLLLLDEILHGTNSEERQIGARWILAS